MPNPPDHRPAWGPADPPPCDGREVLVYLTTGCTRVDLRDVVRKKWAFDYQFVIHWRDLPPGPGEPDPQAHPRSLAPGFYVAFGSNQVAAGEPFYFKVKDHGEWGLCVWGFSVYKRVPGYRTLGIRLEQFLGYPANANMRIEHDCDRVPLHKAQKRKPPKPDPQAERIAALEAEVSATNAALDEIGHCWAAPDAIRDLEAQRKTQFAENERLRAEVAELRRLLADMAALDANWKKVEDGRG